MNCLRLINFFVCLWMVVACKTTTSQEKVLTPGYEAIEVCIVFPYEMGDEAGDLFILIDGLTETLSPPMRKFKCFEDEAKITEREESVEQEKASL